MSILHKIICGSIGLLLISTSLFVFILCWSAWEASKQVNDGICDNGSVYLVNQE